MRIACCLALAALGIAAAPAAAREPRAVLAFLPAESDSGLLERLAGGGFAVAVASPATGGETAFQAYIDIGQGSRVSSRLYEEDLPVFRLTAAGRIAGWAGIVRRAEDAPGDVVPGLLGETVVAGGGSVAYAGVAGLAHAEAAVAADRAGRIETVSLARASTASRRDAPVERRGGRPGARGGRPGRDPAVRAAGPAARSFGARLERLLGRHSLVVARLPRAGALAAVEALPADVLVIVVRAPRADATALLPTAARLSYGGLLTSATTRRHGMVALTDYAPTILDHLGLDPPDEMQGRPIRGASGSWRDAHSLAERLGHIKGRRMLALALTFGAWLLALGAMAATGRARSGLRLGLLAGMWLPGVALATGAIDPSRAVEVAVLAGGSLALALGTDRLVRWPRAPALPAAAVLGAHAVDLVAGSPLIVRSLAGPNPAFGARFYGVGNELEAILGVTVLLGAGALLAGRRGRAVPAVFALVCGIAAVFVGAGRLGADVGGVITLAGGAAAAVLASLRGGVTRRALAAAAAAPALAVAALVAVDLVTGGDAHLSRSVLGADSPRELVEIAERRFETSWNSLASGATPVVVGLFALTLGYGVARWREVLAPLRGERAFAAGMWGALGATVVGALANDSGPTIFVVGAAALILGFAYLRGRPLAGGLT